MKKRFEQALRFLFFALIVRPVIFLILGLNVRNRERLPVTGPAMLVANHNSHLDTPVLMSLLPLRQLRYIRPVAAAGYFLQNRFLAWFATKLIGIIPIPLASGQPREVVLREVIEALENNAIVILFPEGTRGEPEQFGRFKTGIATLAEMMPEVPVHPVYMHGLGKALPKGELLLVPFFCDVFVGEPLHFDPDHEQQRFMSDLEDAMRELAEQGDFAEWT